MSDLNIWAFSTMTTMIGCSGIFGFLRLLNVLVFAQKNNQLGLFIFTLVFGTVGLVNAVFAAYMTRETQEPMWLVVTLFDSICFAIFALSMSGCKEKDDA